MNPLRAKIEAELKEIERLHLRRYPKEFTSAQEPLAKVDGREILLFSSSNYLSLAEHPAVVEQAANALHYYGAGSGGSRLTTGTYRLQYELEEKLAACLQYEAVMLMNSGYHANLGTMQALAGKGTVIFSDEKNHASIIDGCRLSGAQIVVYPHQDSKALATMLAACPNEEKMIVSDGVFSMDGDVAVLPELRGLADRYGALLVVDDAHGFGVLGEKGYGIIEFFGGKARPDVYIGTLSKALGSVGGFVAADQMVIDYLRNKSRSYIFSTSLPAAAVGGALGSLEEMGKGAVAKLQKNIAFLGGLLVGKGLLPKAQPTAIFPIAVGSEEKAAAIAASLWEEGIFIPCIRYPAVPKGKAILRMTVMAAHNEDQMETAVTAIEKHLQ